MGYDRIFGNSVACNIKALFVSCIKKLKEIVNDLYTWWPGVKSVHDHYTSLCKQRFIPGNIRVMPLYSLYHIIIQVCANKD